MELEEAIKLLSKKNIEYYYRYVDVREAVSIVLNLIENQQKELDNIKEIEKLHKEENGKLRVEFEKVYEDNLTLANELVQEKEKLKIAVAMLTKGTYPEENEGDNDYDKYFISKEKIKGMINYREFELQQEYKEFEDDVEWKTYKKILEV